MGSRDDIRALDAERPYDVCIIGAGFGGTILGKALVEQGVRTLILESGHGLVRWMLDTRLHDLAAYDFSGDTDYPLKRTKARALGGNSNFWTGRAERFHPSDFVRHPYCPEDNPWPVTYEELDPYYARAESSLRVRGGGFSEHTAQRADPLPLPASTDITSLKEILAEAGVTLDVSATATPAKAWRFFRVNHEILPTFREHPDLVLLPGQTVTQLLHDETGQITGAETRSLDGTRKTARAKLFVVACGGIETPRLLLLSRSERFPNGIGNGSDQVGRGFNEHASVNFYGKISHRKGTIYPRHKIGRSHQFYDDYRDEGLGALLLNAIQSWVFPNHLLPFRLRDLPGQWRSALTRVVKPTLYLGTTIEMEIDPANRIALSDKRKDRFGSPLAHMIFNYTEKDRLLLQRSRELCLEIYRRLGVTTDIDEGPVNFSMHHQGTCRMGDSASTSVVDRDLRVHESGNLYLCGAETFVTGSAVPPTLTIVALTHRLADHLLQRLGQS